MRGIRVLIATACIGLVAGCGSGTPDLITLTSDDAGPDEFAIVPNRPLATPDSYSALPPPLLGARNRADLTPEADAVAALGGNPAAKTPGATGVQGPALLAHTRRFGVDPAIRATLAAEDLEFRRRNDGRLLERLFNNTVYFRAYERQSLDKYFWLEELRRRGIRTPSAPPENLPE
ncbi:DUF3035 domain-containing protein [Palleronia sediminis]|uniref:DUF3035 domain-containing protein n=1 Tax=Palleronia sediminis TaxID=2547833 RepID=A0A4R6A4J1_9RHOB|nr:DUF3035 domain-containing protein [Palleronia sediminis]TDL76016.1 DUF3035 domain-containing protein [Palleronia sediminis]